MMDWRKFFAAFFASVAALSAILGFIVGALAVLFEFGVLPFCVVVVLTTALLVAFFVGAERP